MCLSDDTQADIIEACHSTSRYLDDIMNIGNTYFEGMDTQIYTTELQSNKANSTDTEAAILDLNLLVSVGFVSFKIYGKCDEFDYDTFNFSFLDGNFPSTPSYVLLLLFFCFFFVCLFFFVCCFFVVVVVVVFILFYFPAYSVYLVI